MNFFYSATDIHFFKKFHLLKSNNLHHSQLVADQSSWLMLIIGEQGNMIKRISINFEGLQHFSLVNADSGDKAIGISHKSKLIVYSFKSNS